MAIVERKNRDGSISYQVKVKDSFGKWYQTPSFSTRALALRHEADLVEKKQKGARAIGDDARNVIVNEYWEVWSVENRPEVSAGWRLSQDQMYRDYVQPVIGKATMMNVGAPEIGRVLNRMTELGRGAQMRLHVYNLLNKMFGDAVGYYRMLHENPVNERFHRPKVSIQQRKFLEPAKAWHLLEQCRDHYIGPAVWIETLSGPRFEAVSVFTWEDVSWDYDQILISKAWKKKIKRLENFPKGKDWEYVPMTPQLKAYLWERWQRSGDLRALICQGPRGGMLSYNTYIKTLKRVCRDLGLPEVTPHELRHSCTELWQQSGANTEDIRRLLNQKSLNATKRYIHRTDERLRRIAGAVGSFQVIEGGAGFPQSFPNGKKEACASSESQASEVC